MMLSEIAKAVGGQMLGHEVGMPDVLCESIGSDSRNIQKNQLFVAIKGEYFDGNTFAQAAIKQGAAVVMVAMLIQKLGQHYWCQTRAWPWAI